MKGSLVRTLWVVGVLGVATLAYGQGWREGRGPRGGQDAQFAKDRADFQHLLVHHDEIRREVTEVPGGVATVTESDNPELAAVIQRHVRAMHDRLKTGRPIRLRDPLFAELFRHADQVQMVLEPTDQGMRVTETSDDPRVVALIRAHARVVSAFVKLGGVEARRNHAVPPVAAEVEETPQP